MAANGEDNSVCVVDASYMLSYLLPDENAGTVDEVFERYRTSQIRLVSLSLLVFEVLNGLRMAVIRGRVTDMKAKTLVRDFSGMAIPQESVDSLGVFKMAVKHKLTVYDAAYLWLAKSKGVTLYSFDKKLVRLAKT